MAIPILKNWRNYFKDPDEGLGSSYERIILNNKLKEICSRFDIRSVLEVPSFGFTGLCGINSMELVKQGLAVSLVDNDKERIGLIKNIWQELSLNIQFIYSENFLNLPFEPNSIDLSWNFSALWFVDDLQDFLTELTTLTRKAILLCVPNRSGLGYISQKFLGKDDLKKYLKEENIMPKNIKNIMKKLNWQLVEHAFIDCPPWPDIGMPKQKFLKIFGLQWLVKKNENNVPLTILDYYNGKNPDFPQQMMQHAWFEKKAPVFLKKIWAHHQYLLFLPKDEK